MDIYLYKTQDEPNKIGKAKGIFAWTQGGTAYTSHYLRASGTIRTPTDILNPVVLLDLTQLHGTLMGGMYPATDNYATFLSQCNYAKIPDFGNRFYFIMNWKTNVNGLMEMWLKVDVLDTYETAIKACSAYVERNENVYVPMLEDNLIPTLADITITTADLSHASTGQPRSNVNLYWDLTSQTSINRFLFSAVCTSSQIPIAYNPTPTTTPVIYGLPSSVCSDEYAEVGGFCTTYVMDIQDIDLVFGTIMAHSGLESFVVSCLILPFEVTANLGMNAGTTPVGIGNHKITYEDAEGHEQDLLVHGFNHCSMLPKLIIGEHEFPTFTDFSQFEPYSYYYFYIPFIGQVQVSAQSLSGAHVIVYYTISSYTGEGTCDVYDMTHARVLHSCPVKLGKRMSVSSTNFLELQNQRIANASTGLLSIIGGAVATIGGAVSMNPLAVGGGILAMAKGGIGWANSDRALIERGSITQSDSVQDLNAPLECKLIIKRQRFAQDLGIQTTNAQWRHQIGNVYKSTATLSSLTGFTICGNVHLTGFEATKTEKDEIETLLKDGVIL